MTVFREISGILERLCQEYNLLDNSYYVDDFISEQDDTTVQEEPYTDWQESECDLEQQDLHNESESISDVATELQQDEYSEQTRHTKSLIIKNFLVNTLFKNEFLKDSYNAYLSLLDSNDNSFMLSAMMFGRHQAVISPDSEFFIPNPFVHVNATYHRFAKLHDSILLNALITEFNITNTINKTYYPFTVLQSLPIEKVLKSYEAQFPSVGYKLYKSESYTVGLLEMDAHEEDYEENDLLLYLINAGLTASPWEISLNIKDKFSLQSYLHVPERNKFISQYEQSSEKNSSLNIKLSSSKYPTSKLMNSLVNLLSSLPVELNLNAITRINLLLDIANTFYRNNYPKYAFYVYAIIHEISVALIADNNLENIEKLFREFMNESEATLLDVTGLPAYDKTQVAFVAACAMSGTHAHYIACELAKKMHTSTLEELSITEVKPTYFEFKNFRLQSNSNIFAITTGPVVEIEGITNGVDINCFIEGVFTTRDVPITLIVDTTTTLYKNLKLNDVVVQKINSGLLSIIFFESHQKYGLLHTDQAQYGRVFGLCAKNSFAPEVIKEIIDSSKRDFIIHPDLRIGAYINTRCDLEDIKEQHFLNGEILKITSNVRPSLSRGANFNTNGGYFVINNNILFEDAIKGIIDLRSSFGHFSTTYSRVESHIRVCASASDIIDAMIEGTQIYLSCNISQLFTLIANIKNLNLYDPLPDEQILHLAVANNIILHLKERQFIRLSEAHQNITYSFFTCILEYSAFKGRPAYCSVQKAFFQMTTIMTHLELIKNIIRIVQRPGQTRNITKQDEYQQLIKYQKNSFFHNSNVNELLQNYTNKLNDSDPDVIENSNLRSNSSVQPT